MSAAGDALRLRIIKSKIRRVRNKSQRRRLRRALTTYLGWHGRRELELELGRLPLWSAIREHGEGFRRSRAKDVEEDEEG